jgi:hypothetical protein
MDENEDLTPEELAAVSGGTGTRCTTSAQCAGYALCINGVCVQRGHGGS